MGQDTLTYDSLAARPLPRWLTDQRDGLNTIQPARFEMKEDRSLGISFTITGIIILLTVAILTVYFLNRKKKNSL